MFNLRPETIVSQTSNLRTNQLDTQSLTWNTHFKHILHPLSRLLRVSLSSLKVQLSINLTRSIRFCRLSSHRKLINPQWKSKTWEMTRTKLISQTLSKPSESQVSKFRFPLIEQGHSITHSSWTEVSIRSMPIRKTMTPKFAWSRETESCVVS